MLISMCWTNVNDVDKLLHQLGKVDLCVLVSPNAWWSQHKSKTKLNENETFNPPKLSCPTFPIPISTIFFKSSPNLYQRKKSCFCTNKRSWIEGWIFFWFMYDRYVPASFSSNRLFVTEVGLFWLLWCVTEASLRCGVKLWRSQNWALE